MPSPSAPLARSAPGIAPVPRPRPEKEAALEQGSGWNAHDSHRSHAEDRQAPCGHDLLRSARANAREGGGGDGAVESEAGATRQEQFILNRLEKKRKLFGFLRRHRHEWGTLACMGQLGRRGLRWLKLLHVLGATVWLGCAVVLSINQVVLSAADGRELHGKLVTLDFIDLAILVPGAILCLLTAIAYSSFTPWGWFKHRWITVKWIICIWGIAFGTYPLGPWLSGLARVADEHGLAALTHPFYWRSTAFGSLQAGTLVVAVVLTVFRPWRKRAEPAGA
jgi:hypothetical protein